MRVVRIGVIGKPHGLKGEVRVFPDNPDSLLLSTSPTILIGQDDRQDQLNISQASKSNRYYIVKFKEITSREQAETLKGKKVFIDYQELAMDTGDDEYLLCDLIGMAVFDLEGKDYGVIKELIDTSANLVFVSRSKEKEFLIPDIPEVVKEIDVDNNRMVIDPPEGLFP